MDDGVQEPIETQMNRQDTLIGQLHREAQDLKGRLHPLLTPEPSKNEADELGLGTAVGGELVLSLAKNNRGLENLLRELVGLTGRLEI